MFARRYKQRLINTYLVAVENKSNRSDGYTFLIIVIIYIHICIHVAPEFLLYVGGEIFIVIIFSRLSLAGYFFIPTIIATCSETCIHNIQK